MFGGWSNVVFSSYKNVKGRVYLYRRVLGACDDRQIIQAGDGSEGDWFGQSVAID